MSRYKDIDDEFYSLSSDVYFKHFFSNSRMLALFLSTLWEKEIKPENITYDNTESNPPRNEEIIYDVVATINDTGVKRIIRVNLEMQNKDYDYLASRMEFYAARKYASSLETGDEYLHVTSEVIWFIVFKDLIKYTNDPTRWSKTPVTEGLLAKEARKMVVEMNNDRRLKNDAFSHEMFLRDQAAMISEGVAKGRAKGKLEIVKNMLKLNLSKEIISASTGFSTEEIEEIIKKEN